MLQKAYKYIFKWGTSHLVHQRLTTNVTAEGAHLSLLFYFCGQNHIRNRGFRLTGKQFLNIINPWIGPKTCLDDYSRVNNRETSCRASENGSQGIYLQKIIGKSSNPFDPFSSLLPFPRSCSSSPSWFWPLPARFQVNLRTTWKS